MSYRFSYEDDQITWHHSVDVQPMNCDFHFHVHKTMELYCFLNGDASFLIEGNEYPLTYGDVIVIGTAEAHKIRFHSNKTYERISIHFSPRILDSIDPSGLLSRPFGDRPLGKDNLFTIHNFSTNLYLSLFTGIRDQDDREKTRLLVLSRLIGILSELSIAFQSRNHNALQFVDSTPANRLIAYINQHIFEDISLESIGSALFLSKSQLNRILNHAIGVSVWQYIRIKRLMAAREQIQNGIFPSIAASSCGFRDYSAFYRSYKSQFGHLPSKDFPGSIKKPENKNKPLLFSFDKSKGFGFSTKIKAAGFLICSGF